jgi:hypothetical protein
MKALAVLAVIAGCATKQTTTSLHNAPGNVDLGAPPAREIGAPDAFERPTDPGTTTLSVIPIPSILLGTGRGNPGELVTDFNLETRFEYHSDKAREPFGKYAVAFTAGLAGVHLAEHRGAEFGALFGEVSFRFPTIKGVVPTDVGVGPVIYPTNFEAGGQITVRFPLLALRLRYVERGGLEFWAGYQVPIPFLFQRSR